MEPTITILEDLGMQYYGNCTTRKHRIARVQCPKCDAIFTMLMVSAKKSKTCSKCAVPPKNYTHRDTDSRLYKIYRGILQRCTNPKVEAYKKYGAVGITICKEWADSYETFKTWAIANDYDDQLSIDRRDNNGNYEPSNCRWVDKSTQTRNTRILYSHNTSGYRGAYLLKKAGKYFAAITINNKQVYIAGYFNTALEAAIEYDKYVIENKLEHTTNGVYIT